MSLVALTEEQHELIAVVDHLVDTTAKTSPRAGLRVPTSPTAWRHLVDGGLLGVGTDEGIGGSGGTTLDLAIIVERLATGPTPVPYLGTVLALALLDTAAAGPGESRRAADDLRATILNGHPATVILDGDLLAPAATGVAFDTADDALVVGSDGTWLFTARGDADLDAVDLTRRLATTTEPVPVAQVEPDSLDRWTARALALVSADLIGAMSGALTEAVAHAAERFQYGQAIGSFQAIQHLCADQLVTIEAARSSMWHAAWAADHLPIDEAISAARVTKAYCSAGALEVTEAAIQVWGGLGMTWEGRAHLFLRRALLSRQVLGDDAHHLATIAERLSASPEGV